MNRRVTAFLPLAFILFFSVIVFGQEEGSANQENGIEDSYGPTYTPPSIKFRYNTTFTLASINEETDGRSAKFGSLSLTKASSPVGTNMSNKLWIDRDDQLMFGDNPISGWWTFSGATLSFPNGYMVLGNTITQANNATIFNVLGRAKVHSFRMADGSEGDGKVLTSDANGVGTWQTSSSGGSIDALFDGKSTPGSGSVYLGEHAGYDDDSDNGTSNTGIGQSALSDFNTSGGAENTALGARSMQYLNNGFNNVAVGFDSYRGGDISSTGSQNTAIGSESMYNYDSGNRNTAVGYQSLYGGSGSSSTASDNVAIGQGALYSNTSGSGNVAIGFEAGFSENDSEKLYIHNSDAGESSLIYGDFDLARLTINGKLHVTQGIYGTVYPGNQWPSDIRYKKNIKELTGSLNKVLNLKGVSYDWRKDEFPSQEFSDGKQIGLIAQEVEKVLPELVNTNEEGYKSVEYIQLTALLIESVKEQQAVIDNLKEQNLDMSQRLESIERMLDNKRFTKVD